MKSKRRVIIADDHSLVRLGLLSILSKSDYNVIYEAQDGNEAVEKIIELKPDILITDISMPYKSGIEILSHINNLNLNVKTIILSMHGDENNIGKCIDLGAKSYILKESVKSELLKALEQIEKDEFYFSQEVLQLLVKNMKERKPVKTEDIKSKIYSFTKREKEILEMVTKGYSNKLISEKLFISTRTVDAHKYNIMQKINVSTSSELVYFVLKNQIL